jgi:molybdopterin-guanine dinucleotide biosynthesis protein A
VARRLTGILLVGGASRRFGLPKALARIGGETLAERAWRVLGEACDERLAVGKVADGLVLPFPFVDDASAVRAPLAGIVAGLGMASHDVCVVLPVDCAAVTAAALRELGRACVLAAMAQTGPLPAAFARGALPVLERRLAAGELRLAEALHELEARVVELDEAQLANANTPAELAAIERAAEG